MLPDAAVLVGGPFLSPPGLLAMLVVLVLVLVVGRILLAITWRLVVIALGVVLGLWLLGAIGLSPL